MKAVVYKTFGAPDVLKLVNHPLPQRSAGELLVKVKSTSVNPVDYKTRNGSIPIAKRNKVMPYKNVGFAGTRTGHRTAPPCNAPARPCMPLHARPCTSLHMQILGGDLAGVIESADADSKVNSCNLLLPSAKFLLPKRWKMTWLAACERRQGVWAFSRLHLHLQMGCVTFERKHSNVMI